MAGIIAGEVTVAVLPDTSGFSAALGAQTTAAASTFSSSLSKGLSSAGSHLTSFGKSMTRYVSLPLIGAGVLATKTAVTFDQTFTRISALAGKLGTSMSDAKKQVEQLAVSTGKDPQELAQALYFVASSGAAAADIFPILTTAAKASATGMGDTETIARTLTATLNAYADSGLTAASASNTLTAAVKDGSAEASDLASTIGAVIPVASQMGITFDQVAATLAAVSNVGVDTARGATGLRFLLQSLQTPTEKATNALDDYGLTIQQVQKSLTEKGLLVTLRDLADTFDLSTEKGKQAFAALIGGARGGVVANALLAQSQEKVNKVFDDTADAAKSMSTNLDDAFSKTAKSSAFQFQQALAELRVAGIKLGTELIPIITHDLIPALESAIRAFNSLSDAQKAWGLGLLVAAGPLLRLTGGVLKLGAGFVRLAGAAGEAAGGIGVFGGALEILGPVAAVVEGLISFQHVLSALASGGEGAALVSVLQEATEWAGKFTPAIAGASQTAQEFVDAFTGGGVSDMDAFNNGQRAIQQQLQSGNITMAEAAEKLTALGEATNVSISDARALAKGLGNEFSAFIHSSRVLKQFNADMRDSTLLSLKQKTALAKTAGAIADFGGHLRKSDQQLLQNRIQTGDFSGALKVLQARLKQARAQFEKKFTLHFDTADFAKKVADIGRTIPKTNDQLSALSQAKRIEINTGSIPPAQAKVKGLQLATDALGKTVAQPKVKVDTSQAIGSINQVKSALQAIPDQTVNVNVVTHKTGSEFGSYLPAAAQGAYAPAAASGGFVSHDQLINVGEHHKPEMILPLQDPNGIRALAQALAQAAAGTGGGTSGPVQITITNWKDGTGTMVQSGIDSEHRFRERIGRMQR